MATGVGLATEKRCRYAGATENIGEILPAFAKAAARRRRRAPPDDRVSHGAKVGDLLAVQLLDHGPALIQERYRQQQDSKHQKREDAIKAFERR